MTIHACLALGKGASMPNNSLAICTRNLLRLKIMAVAAFSAIVRFHVGPNPFRQRQPLSIKFCAGINCSGKMMIEHRDGA